MLTGLYAALCAVLVFALSLRIALLCALLVLIPAALCFYLASRSYRQDLARAKEGLNEAAPA